MTPLRWIVIIGIIGLFVFVKAWVIAHPKGTTALIVGAVLLILSEPAQAQ